MWNFLKKNKAQSTVEYAVMIALVIGAAVAMQTYVKRSMQGGIKFAVDKLQKPDTGVGRGQYEPYYLTSKYDTSISEYKDTVKTDIGGKVTRTFGADNKPKDVYRTGEQTILDTGQQPTEEK